MHHVLAPRDRSPADDLTIPPVHGRAGRGVASIVPHLARQQQINDKPAFSNDWPLEDRPCEAPGRKKDS